MDDKVKENKGMTPANVGLDTHKEQERATRPAIDGKMVKVRISKGRAITGYGKAGDVVDMPEELAKQYERDGYVEILKKESK